MPNKKPLRRFVVGDKQPPEDLELILDGIRFMQEELGIVAAKSPATYLGAKDLYQKLMAKVKPPSSRQIALINRLVSEVGGTVSGKLHSRRHAALLIKELYKVRKTERANAGLNQPWLGPAVFAAVAGILLCVALWPEALLGWLLLIGILVFVVGGAIHVLGLWQETFSIIFRSRLPGD